MSLIIDGYQNLVGNSSRGFSLIRGYVDTYASLPSAVDFNGEFWFVRTGSSPYIPLTTWYKYPAGLYIAQGGQWDIAPIATTYAETTGIRSNITDWAQFYPLIDTIKAGDLVTYNGKLYANQTGILSSTAPDTDETNWTSKVAFNTDNEYTVAEGEIGWSASNGTLQIGMPGGNVTLDVGQENLVRVKNTSGSVIANGAPVYVTENVSAGFVTISAADASVPDNCRKTLAVATEEIGINQLGYVTTFGLVRDVNTDGYTEGGEIFVAVGGGFTQTRPALPNSITKVGVCVQADSTAGVIFVTILQRSSKGERTDSGDWTLYTASGYTAVLDQPVYEDLNFSVASAGGPVATRPDYVTIDNVVYSEFTSANNQLCAGGNELPHEYKLGGDLKIHLHGFLKSGESVGTTGVQFTIYWALRQQNGTTYTNGSAVFSVASASLNNVNVNFYSATSGAETITGSSTLGAQLYLTLARTGGDAGDFIVTTYGIHYPIDTMGSRQVSSK